MNATTRAISSLLDTYDKEIKVGSAAATSTELEVRFTNVTYEFFTAVAEALLDKQITFENIGDGNILEIVNIITSPRHSSHQNIQQILFDPLNKGQKDTQKNYYIKNSISFLKGVSSKGVSYKFALSSEKPSTIQYHSTNQSIIRIKLRISFLIRKVATSALWRVDLTAVKQLKDGYVRGELSSNVRALFQTENVTPQNFLQLVRDASLTYEIELELQEGRPSPQEVEALIEVISTYSSTQPTHSAFATGINLLANLFQKYRKNSTLKQLLPQSQALTCQVYNTLYPPIGFYLLDKADGERGVALINNNTLYLLCSHVMTYPGPKNQITAVDGEVLYIDGKWQFFVFDVLYIDGVSFMNKGYNIRITQMARAVEMLTQYGLTSYVKPFIQIRNVDKSQLKEDFQSPVFLNRPYKVDGKILVASNQPYAMTNTFKWKPPEFITIDFLAKKPPSEALSSHPFSNAPNHQLYYLFVGISYNQYNKMGIEKVSHYNKMIPSPHPNYFPIQFAPPSDPLAYLYQHPMTKSINLNWVPEIDNLIIELRPTPNGWEFIRVRTDRVLEQKMSTYYGNDYRIAVYTWMNAQHPLTEEDLWNGPQGGYFKSQKAPMYQAMTGFASYIKSQQFKRYISKASWVVDLGIGRGADINRYAKNGVRHVVGIDKDYNALEELVKRKIESTHLGRTMTTLYTLQANLTESYTTLSHLIKNQPYKFPPSGADAVIVYFIVNYVTSEIAYISNFAALCRSLVKKGGTVLIITMLGDRVTPLFQKYLDSWKKYENGVLKYHIKRMYKNDQLTAAGQEIGIKFPFSCGELYMEYLVNSKTLIKEFTDRGFTLKESTPFSANFENFSAANPIMAARLTQDDYEYLSLFGEIIFQRNE